MTTNGNGIAHAPALPPPPKPKRVSKMMLGMIAVAALALIYFVLRPGERDPNQVQDVTKKMTSAGKSKVSLGDFPSTYADMFSREAAAAPKEPDPAPPPPPTPEAPPPNPPPETAVVKSSKPARQPPSSLRLAGFTMAQASGGAVAVPGRNSRNAETATDAGSEDGNDNRFDMDFRVEKPKSPWIITTGKFLPVALRQGLRVGESGAISSFITAYMRESVWDRKGRYVLIPQNTELFGFVDSSTEYGQKRIIVHWQRLIFPDGKTFGLQGFPSAGVEGYQGVPGKVNNHFFKIVGGVILSTMLRVATRIPAGTIESDDGLTPEQQFAIEASEGIGDASDKILNRILRLGPTITAKPGAAFNVLVIKDMVLEPYRPL